MSAYSILQLTDSDQGLGGAQSHFRSLCNLLISRGYSVETFFTSESSKRRDHMELQSQLKLVLKRFRPDIVHVHAIQHKHLWVLEQIGEIGQPIVQTWHDHGAFCLNHSLYSHSGYCEHCKHGKDYFAGLRGCVNIPLALNTWWSRRIKGEDPYKHLKGVIVPSRYLMEKAQEWGMEKNFYHINHFVDTPLNMPQRHRQPDLIVYSGRLSHLKGIEVLLAAIQDIPCRLLILGDGELRGKVQQAVEQADAGKIIWPGTLSGSEYWEYLTQGSILVSPSLCPESFGLVIGDGFSVALPVVATDIGAAKELIGNAGERGILVKPGDVNGLRQALIRLLADPEQAATKGAAGKLFVDHYLTPDRYYGLLMNCYQEVLR